MTLRKLYLTASYSILALPVLATGFASTASAQVEITDALTAGILTSTASDDDTPSDVTLASTGSITITSGTAITIDSDNTVINNGSISSMNVNDTTGVLISGGNTGGFSNTGTISLSEDTPEDGITAGGDIATGSGRVGILISGASPFIGNVENETAGSITIRGQESSGIKLADMSSITGNISHNGSMAIFGERSTGMNIAGTVIGNLAMGGSIATTGEDTNAINISGDIDGSTTISGSIRSNAYVSTAGAAITTRQSLTVRDTLLEEASLRQTGSAVKISGNLSQGIRFAQFIDEDGETITATASVAMFGSAPAVLIDGNGTPIALGRVGQITDINDADYDAELQYAFVNQGTLTADGLFDDVSTTVMSFKDVTLTGGINNSGTLRANTYRSGIVTGATTTTSDAPARVIVIGGGAIAERINNSGTILATASEATDSIYLDPDNILNANRLYATAIDIDANGSLSEITNINSITVLITGRKGEAIAIRDASGTLITLNNSGTIFAGATSTDTTGEQTLDFTLTAIDVSANTTGFTLNQTAYTDPDTEENTTPVISGRILLGSGADTLNIASGTVVGDISFGDGMDTLALSNEAIVTTALTNGDGQLDIALTGGSTLNITAPETINITSLTVDGTSIYSPHINPKTGEVSTLIASGTVSFADGATIAPSLETVLDSPSATFTIVDANLLNIDTSVSALRSEQTPYLYDTTFARSATNQNTLVMSLAVRTPDALGLDQQQASLFTSAFEALQSSDTLGSAFVALTDQESFNAAYNQLLPEFAAASRQFVMANVDGASGAVGSHLDAARRSQDRSGGAWIQEFAYYADRELAGMSEQFRGYGFGITGGFDTRVGPFHTAGINIGFATTEIEDVLGLDEPLDVLTIQGGLYAGYETGNFGVDLYAGAGYNDFEAERNVVIGDFAQSTQADWSGTHYNASAKAGYDISFGKYFIRPAVTASYLSLREKAYSEEGTSGIELAIDKRTVDTATATATLDFGARFEREKSWIAPSFRIGYRNDFINDSVITTGRFVNGATPFSVEAQEFPDSGFVLGVTFATGSQYSSFAFDYDADIRDGFSRHTARLVLRLLF